MNNELILQAMRDDRRLVEVLPLSVLIARRGIVQYANGKLAELSGYPTEVLVGRSFLHLIHVEDQARLMALHERQIAGQVDGFEDVFRFWRRDGVLRHCSVHVTTVSWGGGQAALSILIDVTEHVLVQRRLRELSSIVEQASDAIMLTATDGTIQYVNPGFERLTGYSADELVGKTPSTMKSGVHGADFYRQLWATIEAGRPFHAQVINRRKDGTYYHAVKTITPMVDGEGRIVSYVNIDKDFTAQHEAQQRAAHLAMHDPLTGLPNRAQLTDQIGQAIAKYGRDEESFSLLFIDLDGFKEINDQLGHQTGDEVLKEIAGRLRMCLRAVDAVARIGGDEFVVLLSGVGDEGLASSIADALVKAIREPVVLSSGVCRVGASVGISLCPRDGESFDTLLQGADHAMYAAKRSGGNRSAQAGMRDDRWVDIRDKTR